MSTEVAGAMRSGEVVAKRTKSMSSGPTPASAIALRPAMVPKERAVPPMRRSRMPVRSEIHSSLVSRVSDSSSFVTMRSGRPIPQPLKRTPMMSAPYWLGNPTSLGPSLHATMARR